MRPTKASPFRRAAAAMRGPLPALALFALLAGCETNGPQSVIVGSIPAISQLFRGADGTTNASKGSNNNNNRRRHTAEFSGSGNGTLKARFSHMGPPKRPETSSSEEYLDPQYGGIHAKRGVVSDDGDDVSGGKFRGVFGADLRLADDRTPLPLRRRRVAYHGRSRCLKKTRI